LYDSIVDVELSSLTTVISCHLCAEILLRQKTDRNTVPIAKLAVSFNYLTAYKRDSKNQLDQPIRRFDRTLTCDRQKTHTDRHRASIVWVKVTPGLHATWQYRVHLFLQNCRADLLESTDEGHWTQLTRMHRSATVLQRIA